MIMNVSFSSILHIDINELELYHAPNEARSQQDFVFLRFEVPLRFVAFRCNQSALMNKDRVLLLNERAIMAMEELKRINLTCGLRPSTRRLGVFKLKHLVDLAHDTCLFATFGLEKALKTERHRARKLRALSRFGLLSSLSAFFVVFRAK